MNYKQLGQHFLKNTAAIEKIIAALDLQEGETVVEIGPGHGELTKQMANGKWLMANNSKIIAVEKDKYLADELESRIKNQESRKIKIINDDILKVLPFLNSKFLIHDSKYKLVGNIPFYLTGFLFRTIGELENKPSLIVFTIQKEVAERIVAEPPRMNLLAASIQIWAKPEIIAILPPTDFDPPPKVTSAIIRLGIRNQELGIRGLENYYKLIKIIFKQPRKTILNNLSDGLNITKEEVAKKLTTLGLSGTERGQNLSVDQLISLSKKFLIPNS